MGAAERIEWQGECPARLQSEHPCDQVWDEAEALHWWTQHPLLFQSEHPCDATWDAVDPEFLQAAANDNGRLNFPLPRAARAVSGEGEARALSQEIRHELRTAQGEAQPAQAQGASLPITVVLHRSAEQAGGWGLPQYKFTGKEEDVEVGLQYFGKRYLNPLLGRWISADPLEVHVPGGSGEFNAYAYVSGHVLKNVDPLGLEEDQEKAVSFEANQSSSEGGVSDGQNQSSTPEASTGEVSYNGGAGTDHSYNAVAGAGGAGGGPTPTVPAALEQAEGTSGAADGKVGSGETPNPALAVVFVVGVGVRVAGEIAKSATSLPTGDTACSTQADCNRRSANANAQSALMPVGVFAWRTASRAGRAGTGAAPTGSTGPRQSPQQQATKGGLRPVARSLGAAGDDLLLKKAVNSNLPHAVSRGVERGVFGSADEAAGALRGLTEQITRSGTFPSGTLVDTARAGRFLVPVGNNGRAVYQLASNGTAKLKTVLIGH